MIFNRREFLGTAAIAALAALSGSRSVFAAQKEPLYKISLAQWSLHRTLRAKKIDNLDFAKIAREEFGIDGIEYVNQFFKDKTGDQAYMADMKKRASDHGVTSVLIMVDGEGQLGDPNTESRLKAVENHKKWLEAAAYLGCHSIRVNAASSGTWEEQAKLASDGLEKLTRLGESYKLNVIVENHGGLSSNAKWLSEVISAVNLPTCGTLPDFGNFRIKDGEYYDRYQGVDELMKFAKAVSAKTHEFDENGNDTGTDYLKMMKIVLAHDYHGYVGIEYEGKSTDEYEGIRKSKALLEKVEKELRG